MKKNNQYIKVALLFAIFAILFAPVSITLASLFELKYTKFISVISLGVGFSIFFLISSFFFGAYAAIKKLESNTLPSTGKSFLSFDIKDFISCAKNFNKDPITQDKYIILKQTYLILADRENRQTDDKNYTNDELKLLTKAGKILFDHLEIEFMISASDPLKIKKINEELLVGTLKKIKPDNKTYDITGQELEEIFIKNPKNKKNFH